jgi:voltage-gated potassium channel
MPSENESFARSWRANANRIIFEADTPAGKAFDVLLIAAILLSISTVMLESIDAVQQRYGAELRTAEWGFTVLFTVEYALRLVCAARPTRYARSFFGIVDLLSIVPTYASVLIPGAQALLVIRTLRILRVFRVLKLANYIRESETLLRALYASRRKISVFLFTVFTLVVVFGSLMYVVEGPESGFTSIPRGIYWAIVTLTTVGYGDIAPQTNLGQTIAAMIMILGYGIIAVPTGIITAELAFAGGRIVSKNRCPACSAGGHDADAAHCKMCGASLA